MQFCKLQRAEPRSTNVKNGAAEGGVCQITDHLNEGPLAFKNTLATVQCIHNPVRTYFRYGGGDCPHAATEENQYPVLAIPDLAEK